MRQLIPELTATERREKHRIFLRDAVALGSLSVLVIALSFVTYALFHSFATHRSMLEQRWQKRGEASLAAGQPIGAINDLHSALSFAPDDRQLQIELATALAAAGKTREAQVYFTTLLEREPGSGIINLELARLAVRQGNIQVAVDHYQAAIDGTWNGDGYVRRRTIRLEMAQMLIAQGMLPEARNQLLIAAGNAPDDHALQLRVGAMLLTAGDPADATELFAKAAKARTTRLQALEGEAKAAQAQGRYEDVRNVLSQAVAESAFNGQPQAVRDAAQGSLDEANSILALYPADDLPRWVRAQRIAKLAQIAQTRLAACPAAAAPAATAGAANVKQQQLLFGLAAHLQQLNPLKHLGTANAPSPAEIAPGPAADSTLPSLTDRWAGLPTGNALVQQIANDPDFAQSTLDLTYATARATVTCGAPSGEAALLLQIAKAPDQVKAP